jgi:hypothetical protein
MQVEKVFVNGEEASFEFVQPTYPGDPNGQDDPDPAAHQSGQNIPVSPTNPLPPACTPEEPSATANGQPCPARKLVITPPAPIPSGETFEVKVEYVGHPGVYTDGGGEAEGWFRSDEPAGDGSFVTTEPVGTEAWMPLNNHPSAKPTYDFHETVTGGRTVIANGELVSKQDNAPDAQFPAGSTTWVWHSPEPIANYLVENSVGEYDLTDRQSPDGITYFEAQGSSITEAQKATNKAVMDQQEDITHFQERFNGPFPLSTDGVVIGVPDASFEEEMQGKITFNGGKISLGTFNHENMHQWWGDNVSESNFNETFFKEGMARLSEYLATARTAAVNAGGLDTPAGEAAFDASLVARFHTNYIVNGTMWTRAPSNPTPVTLFSTASTYNRPATAYIALRQILGKGNFVGALKEIQRDFGGGSIEESQLEAEFQHWLPNQSAACKTRLNAFFGEWFDTAFPSSGEPTALRPQLTGPGLDASASGATFYDATGPCTQAAPVTTAKILPAPVDGKVAGPATVVLTAKDSTAGVATTEYSLDGGEFQAYDGPFTVAALGSHTIAYRSTSAGGAVEPDQELGFTVVAHDAPLTTARVLPEPVDGKVVGSAAVVLSATDNGGGVASTEYSLDGGEFQVYDGPFTVTALGDHTVEFRSTNGDGVVEATKQIAFTVVAPPQPPQPPVAKPPATKPVCAQPQLAVRVAHTARAREGRADPAPRQGLPVHRPAHLRRRRRCAGGDRGQPDHGEERPGDAPAGAHRRRRRQDRHPAPVREQGRRGVRVCRRRPLRAGHRPGRRKAALGHRRPSGRALKARLGGRPSRAPSCGRRCGRTPASAGSASASPAPWRRSRPGTGRGGGGRRARARSPPPPSPARSPARPAAERPCGSSRSPGRRALRAGASGRRARRRCARRAPRSGCRSSPARRSRPRSPTAAAPGGRRRRRPRSRTWRRGRRRSGGRRCGRRSS